ncbi:hypothetical protein Tco_0398066 [Tanacetum coccineum]
MCLPELQQQTLKPSFEARVQSYMAAPIERMQRFKEVIYKQREETNERMFEKFIILREYTKGKALEKVLVREEVSKFVTKYANAISLIRIEDDADKECGEFIDKEAIEQIKVAEKEKVVEDVEDNESDKSMNEDSTIWDKFETYVKSKDLDLWHVITDGDFPLIQFNPETKKDEIVSFHKQNDDLKKKLAKNNEAKMVIYNALPRKEYERIFMCQTAKEIWDTLLITHQGNNQVKANKIDLLVQQYEQFMILEEESIDNAFAKFNTIITSLKALDEGFSSKNCVRKFF